MKQFDRLVEIIKKLRSPKGCPWDRAQKVTDYERYLLEEAYELIEAIRKAKAAAVEEELGDLYLILTMLVQMYSEKGKFTQGQVLDGICDKLIIRHPHVFADKNLKDKDKVLAYWIRHKAKEKNRKTVKDRLPTIAPALLLAEISLKEQHYLDKIKGRSKSAAAKSLGDDIIKQVKALAGSGAQDKVLADLLYDLCRLAFIHKLQPESLLRAKVLNEAEKILY
jgi:tetrapyrrole methylase family protein/MazG family protein